MTDHLALRFNPPPGWPRPPVGWKPPKGWAPDPAWPAPPPGWQLWVADVAVVQGAPIAQSNAAEAWSAESDRPVSMPASEARMMLLESENAALRARLAALNADPHEAIVLDDERVLQEVGIYRYHHPLENAAAYKDRLTLLESRIAELVKTDRAIEVSQTFTLDGSLAHGRRMAQDIARLALRAYNAEADNAIRSLRVGNVVTAKKRLEACQSGIAKLGTMMGLRIAAHFHALRIEEIELTADHLMRKAEEREAAREERERLREERKVEQELAAERERLDKERNHLVTAIESIRSTGASASALEGKLAALDEAIANNDYRAANIRAGYVYVISNRGAFGEHVVKIGLTRRLEPMERIDELGDASVPFRFDVHALYFSEDAVSLEAELHRHFAEARLNRVNHRREFFFATPSDVRTVLMNKVGNLLEFTERAEAVEYHQSVHAWPKIPPPASRP